MLHCQNVAGGEAQPVTALSQLRFAELTAYDAASGRMAALFLLSPYGSVCGTAVFDPETGAISLLQEQRYQVMLAPAGGMSLLAFDNDKMGYSACAAAAIRSGSPMLRCFWTREARCTPSAMRRN